VWIDGEFADSLFTPSPAWGGGGGWGDEKIALLIDREHAPPPPYPSPQAEEGTQKKSARHVAGRKVGGEKEETPRPTQADGCGAPPA